VCKSTKGFISQRKEIKLICFLKNK
jgi:hypothetical protein